MKTNAYLAPKSNLFLCATHEHAETANELTEVEVLEIDSGIANCSTVKLPSGWNAIVDTAAITPLKAHA